MSVKTFTRTVGLFLLSTFTASVAQGKSIYFSYDSPVNIIFTVYENYDDDDGMGEVVINGQKIIGTIKHEEEVANEGQFNERYVEYNVFYETKPSFCSEGMVFLFLPDNNKGSIYPQFKCETLLSNKENVGYLYLINRPNNIKLLSLYDGYRIMNDVTLMNDKAYYLELLGAYTEAIYILKKVISKSPDRAVAYLNIADAYWGNNEKVEAKKSYKKYVELMKSQGKDIKKIPQRVYDRIKFDGKK